MLLPKITIKNELALSGWNIQ